MRLFDHLGIDAAKLDEYILSGLVDRAEHATFPLAMLTYGRKAVYDHVWDSVTSKCRSLIYNIETQEIVARSFEKFHNFGAVVGEYAGAGGPNAEGAIGEPEVWEKMDGFLCTMYTYAGKSYIASKGSFRSPHAKWATNWYQRHETRNTSGWVWPEGYTPVFEGITPNLRIVVDYGRRAELVLLALINNETGEELNATALQQWAYVNAVTMPTIFKMSTKEATENANSDGKNFEGYVLVWRRPGKTPYRLKVKYLDYLRLHRFVTQVSPKRILEALSNGWDDVIDEYVNNSTPWFKRYVEKWKKILEREASQLEAEAEDAFTDARKTLNAPPFGAELPTRKQWAEIFTNEQYDPISSILFGLLDGKDVKKIIWKRVKEKTVKRRPLIDARSI